MTSSSNRTKPPRLLPVLFAIALVVAAVLVVRSTHFSRPSLFVNRTPSISKPLFANGAWFWIEQRDSAHALLVRVDASGTKHEIASDDQIGDFAVGNDHLLVISQSAKMWRVRLTDSNGMKPLEIWSGEEQPHGALIAGNSAYRMRPKPAAMPNGEVFPPLGPQVELVSSPLGAGESRVISSIMEPLGDAVIGVFDEAIWLSARRLTTHGVTTIYRVQIAGGTAQRVVAETGYQSAVLTPTGALYWTAPSCEAENFDEIVCIRRLSPSGTSETLNEWLPARGRLYATNHGVLYVDGTVNETAWPVTTHADLPTPDPYSNGYFVLAAGENDLLMRRKNDPNAMSAVYRVWER